MRTQTPWRKRKRSLRGFDKTRIRKILSGASFAPRVLESIRKRIEEIKKERKEECLRSKKRRVSGAATVEFHPDRTFGFRIRKPHHLYDHQARVVRWAENRKANPMLGIRGGIIALEMGTGKTLSALSIIKRSQNEKCNLIVCQKSLMRSISEDARKFFGAEMPHILLHPESVGVESFTAEHMKENRVLITTYSIVRSMAISAGLVSAKGKRARDDSNLERVEPSKLFFSTIFENVFCDESQTFVNQKTQIFQSVMKIVGRYKFCLTGTPMRNYDSDLHSQLLFCGLDPTLLWSRQNYEEKKLDAAILCMSVEEAEIKLPEKEHVKVRLDFSREEREAHESIVRKALSLYTDNSKSYAAILVMIMRARQACISGTLVDKKLPERSTKIRRLVEIVQEVPTEKFLVFSSFASALRLVSDALTERNIGCALLDGTMSSKKRQSTIQKFTQDPDIRVLVMTYKVGCTGLNLVAANHVIILDPWWNNWEKRQATARVWRIGQPRKVYVWELLMRESVEERLLQTSAEKDNVAKNFLTFTREQLARMFIK